MSFNFKLGYGLALEYGFTNAGAQGAVIRKDLVQLPSVQYCHVVPHLARRNEQRRKGKT